MTTNRNQPAQGTWWPGLRSALSLLTITGFLLTSLYAKLNPIQGQEAAPAQKAPAAKAPVAAGPKTDFNSKAAKNKKKKTEDAKAVALGVVPGTGKKLNYRELAK